MAEPRATRHVTLNACPSRTVAGRDRLVQFRADGRRNRRVTGLLITYESQESLSITYLVL